MPLPEKIPICHHIATGACVRSDVVVAHDDAKHVSFFCRSCQGLQVFTRDNVKQPQRQMRSLPELKRYWHA